MLETAWQDLRHGTRMLVKNPGFTLVAVLSIAIGVGANTAMFSVADGLIFRPLGVPEASGLVTVNERLPTGDVRNGGISYPDYADLRDRSRSFESLTAFRGVLASFARRRNEQAEGRYGLAVTGTFFDVLRVRPALGRVFVPDEDRVPGRDAVVVLAHETWTEQFGADLAIVGRDIRLGGRDFTVVGVAPERFTGVEIYLPPAFYVPLAMLPAIDAGETGILQRRDVRRLDVLGRLRPGVSLAQASQEAGLIATALAQTHPATNRQYGMLVRTETEARFEEYAPMYALGVMLLGLALAVLLVACTNVAGLLASRAPVRARELAVRLAVGGSRVRLMRQLLTESLLIAAAGGAAGLALGYGGIRSFQQFQVPSDVGVRLTYQLDRRALLVGFVVAGLSALVSSLMPAWRSSRARDLSSTLRHATPLSSAGLRLWGRHGLVATQIALTLVVLTVAVSFYRAFEAEYGRGPGFRTDHLLLATVDPDLARYDARQAEEFYQRLEERVSAIPGVTSVATSSFVPLSQGAAPTIIVPDGYELPPGTESLTVMAARVDEDYLATIGIPLVAGRHFDRRDTADAPRVAIVSGGMARRYWPGQDPLDKRIRLTASNEWAAIVGVAADTKFRLFTPPSTPFLYLPRRQSPPARSTLLVRTAGDSASVAAPVRAAIADLDREMPILLLRTMEDFYYASARNLNTVVVRTVAGMGTMGLALALIGLYGLMAYAVSRRTREIGIRMAVGAMPRSVFGMILRQGCLPSACGVALGVPASVGVGGLLRSAFAGTGGDVLTYLLVVPAIVIVVSIAAYIPARRAASIDPLTALRQD